MIFRNSDFWIGVFSSTLAFSFTLKFLLFRKSLKFLYKFLSAVSSYPEYERYKKIRIDMPRIKGDYSSTWGQLYEQDKPYPDSEMSEPEILGLKEEKERRKVILYIEEWESNMPPIAFISCIALFYLIGAKIYP